MPHRRSWPARGEIAERTAPRSRVRSARRKDSRMGSADRAIRHGHNSSGTGAARQDGRPRRNLVPRDLALWVATGRELIAARDDLFAYGDGWGELVGDRIALVTRERLRVHLAEQARWGRYDENRNWRDEPAERPPAS